MYIWAVMTQRQLAAAIGVSPSRISDFVTGRSEASLKIARLLCTTLGIAPVPCWVADNSFSFIMECSVQKLEIFNSDMHN
jgi:transcriptional regulator with XRE-family HTH domain